MGEMPKRADSIYKEIESFEDYELTQCIAYEMAIRNTDNLNQIKEVIKIYNKYKLNNEYKNYYLSYTKDRLKEIELLPTEEEIFFSEYYTDIKRLGTEIYALLEDLYKYDEDDTNIKYDGVTMMIQKGLDTATVSSTVSKKGFSINTMVSLNLDECTIPIDESGEDMTYVKIETLADFSRYVLNTSNDETFIARTSIIENFKRPQLNISKLKNKNTMLEIDLNRPQNEIIAYIEHIKSNMGDIKSPIELLGAKLEKANNIVCNTKGKCFDTRATLAKQQKISDMFYIYDCIKIGLTQTKIRNEIYNYYADNGMETQTMDFKTLKKYKEIAVDYIDNMRYKELITGVKL